MTDQEHKTPVAWFVLEHENERPYISEASIDVWGGLLIPIFDKEDIRPGYTDPLNLKEFTTSARLSFDNIEQVAKEAGRIPSDVRYFPENLSSISLPRSCGRLLLNICGYKSLEDYGYNQDQSTD